MGRVPDPRLDRLSEMYQPRKITPAIVRYVDVPAVGGDRPGEASLNIPELRTMDQIEQVLVTLVMNARDALPEGGEILINTAELELAQEDLPTGNSQARPGRYALLLVRDTGVGMASQVLSHVFEPFFTTKEVGQGSGLALATVYGIVSQSRGFVTVDITPGEGSTFRVYLPLAQEDPAPQQAL